MTATNEAFLSKNPGIIEVVKMPTDFLPLASDLSNVKDVKTAIDELDLIRIASVIDLQTSENYSDQIVVEADDTGAIYTSAEPSVTISGSFYETWNPKVQETILNKVVIEDETGTFTGNTLSNQEIPPLIIRITATDPVTTKVKQSYIINASFSGELITQYLNPKRAGNLPNSPFEFSGQAGGGIFTYQDDLVVTPPTP